MSIARTHCLAYFFTVATLFQFAVPSGAEEHRLEQNDSMFDYSQLVGKSWSGDAPVTFTELRALEPLCKLMLTNWVENNLFWLSEKDHPVFQRPEFRMGQGANWIHHYCHGKLAKFRFLTSIDKSVRSRNLSQWQLEMEYSINGSNNYNKNYAYRYDIFTELAESYYYDNKLPQAISNATKAIHDNKTHARAYRVLADSYIKSKNPDKALATVNEGLKAIPESKLLLLLHSELTGKSSGPSSTTPHQGVK